MGQVAEGGRTVLFVSHNLIAVQSMCSRVVWLSGGQIVENGSTEIVVSKYLKATGEANTFLEELWDDFTEAPGNEIIRLHRVRVHSQHEALNGPLTMKTPFLIEIEYWNLLPDANLHVTLHLYTEQEIIAFTTGSTADSQWNNRPLPLGLFRSTCYIPGELLNAGRHRFALFFVKDKSSVIYRHDSKVIFEITDLQERDGGWYGKEPGVVQPALRWTTAQMDES
jgi:lipopolysaccharide transport system ATP-binding protein